MKIYLSKYWIADHISLVCVEVVIVVATAAFCIEYRDEENILLIICSLVLIGITYYVQSRVIYLLDYVEVSNNQFTQYSFSGKRKRAVNSDEPIYYQIVPLIEGVYSRADFIVLLLSDVPCCRNNLSRYSDISLPHGSVHDVSVFLLPLHIHTHTSCIFRIQDPGLHGLYVPLR